MNFSLLYTQLTISYFALLSCIIPINIYICLEIIKNFQTSFLENDVLMYSPSSQAYLSCLNFSLHEELSRVKIMFCDKTGTLTKNELKLKFLIILGNLYDDKANLLNSINEDIDLSNRFKDETLSIKVKETEHYKMYIKFMECILLCNSIYLKNKSKKIEGSSPEEIALIEGIILLSAELMKNLKVMH